MYYLHHETLDNADCVVEGYYFIISSRVHIINISIGKKISKGTSNDLNLAFNNFKS